MAGQDRTGPLGQGPLTGRGLGLCGNGRSQGFGCKRGFGRGYGFRRSIPLTKDEEKKILESELEGIGLEKQKIEKRLKEIN